MHAVLEKFRSYGQQTAVDPDLVFAGAGYGAGS
jgi:hypothetical protein